MNEFRIFKIRKYRRKMHKANMCNLDILNNPEMSVSSSSYRYVQELEEKFKRFEELEYDYKYYMDLCTKAAETMKLEQARRSEDRKRNLYKRVDELEKEIQDIKKRLD